MTLLAIVIFGLIVQLPNGQQITSNGVVYDLDTETVFVLEAPIFGNSFE